MSFYSPESRRISFDYEISAGKAALRVFKHEKDFERLYLIPMKNIQESLKWRLTIKPEVNDNIFGIINGTSSSSDTSINKRLSGGTANAFTFAPPSQKKLGESISSTRPDLVFSPPPAIVPGPSPSGNLPAPQPASGRPMIFRKTLDQHVAGLDEQISSMKVAIQVTLLNVSKSLQDEGLKTSIKIVFRDKPSIIILQQSGTCTFTENERNFDISMAINDFNSFQKEIIVNVELTISNMDESVLKNVYIRDLSNDFSNLYETKQYTDTTLVVDDGEFQVHRGILAARSEVFCAMFDKTMKEGISGTAVIEDMDKEVLNELLYYIYSGRVKNLKEYGPGLLVASDKYNIPMLKEICEDFLANNLSLEVACEGLILADIHTCNSLKPRCTKFLIDNALQVTKTTGWKNMIKSHPYLVAEMFEAMAISSESAASAVNEAKK